LDLILCYTIFKKIENIFGKRGVLIKVKYTFLSISLFLYCIFYNNIAVAMEDEESYIHPSKKIITKELTGDYFQEEIRKMHMSERKPLEGEELKQHINNASRNFSKEEERNTKREKEQN
jgi:hypothetical protein